jgi:branched-chain amino acid transport system permease protein
MIEQLPQQLVNGLTLGGVYALLALGYSMVYGVLRLLNFAHGDVFMVGAFVGQGVLALLLADNGGNGEAALALPPWAVIAAMLLAAMLVSGALGVAIELVAYRPLRAAPRLSPLLGSLGVSFFLQNAVLLIASARPRAVATERLLPAELGFGLGTAQLSPVRLLVMFSAVALMVALHVLVRRSRLGRAMRAVAVDRDAAAMMGVDVDRVIAGTFFLGWALAGAAGVLMGLVFNRVWHLMGFTAGLKGFTAAVVGGIGSMPGAMAGGLLLGLAAGIVSPTYKDLIAFALLLLVLLLRPAGLFGQGARPKV